MSDDVARAVGAKGSEFVVIDGIECHARPLGLAELAQVERECLSSYRKEWVKGYYDNLEYIPESKQEAFILDKIDQAAAFKLTDLPPKFVYDPMKIELTNEIRSWLTLNMDEFLEDAKPGTGDYDKALRIAAVNALETDVLKDNEYEKMAKKPAKKTKVGYIHWWITATHDGMLTLMWQAFSDLQVSKSDISKAVGRNRKIVASIAREIEKLSAPDSGNG